MAWNSIAMGCASRCLAVPLATIALLAPCAGTGTGLNPAAAIAAAAGHPSQHHLRAEATRLRAGQTETATLEMAGTKRLEQVCDADLCTGTWFDGTRLAAFGINGTPLPDAGTDDRTERTFAAIASTAFGEPEFIGTGGKVEALPGKDGAALRYRVTAPQGATLVAVADASTHRLAGVEFPDKAPYRPLSATTSGSTVVYAARAYDSVATPAASLMPPAGPKVTVTEQRELPLLSSVLPVLPCTLGGRAASCLIDTGSTPSAVTLAFAEKLGREPHGAIEIAGLGPYLTGVVDAGPLVLGGATLDALHWAVIPRARGADFDVLIGSDALENLRIGLDPGRRRATIAASRTQPDGTPIPVSFTGGLPFAQVRLGTRDRTESMLVDTGDSGILSIGYDEYREDMELFPVRGSSSAVSLGTTSMNALQGELPNAEIGGEPADHVAINAVRGQHQGHIGYGFALLCGRLDLELGQNRIECFRKVARP